MPQLTPSLQDTAAPDGVCYGCGSSNPDGLHIKSFWDEDGVHVRAEYLPLPDTHQSRALIPTFTLT